MCWDLVNPEIDILRSSNVTCQGDLHRFMICELNKQTLESNVFRLGQLSSPKYKFHADIALINHIYCKSCASISNMCQQICVTTTCCQGNDFETYSEPEVHRQELLPPVHSRQRFPSTRDPGGTHAPWVALKHRDSPPPELLEGLMPPGWPSSTEIPLRPG